MKLFTYPLLGLVALTFGFKSTHAVAGDAEIAARVAEIAKGIDAMGESAKVFAAALDRTTIATIVDWRNSEVVYDAVHGQVLGALKKDKSIQAAGLTDKELDELSHGLMSHPGNSKSPLNVVQRYLARRYFITARTATGAAIESGMMSEPKMQKMVAWLESRGIKASYTAPFESMPPQGTVVAQIKGDKQAKDALTAFSDFQTQVEDVKAGGANANLASVQEVADMQARARQLQAELDNLKARLSGVSQSGTGDKPVVVQPVNDGSAAGGGANANSAPPARGAGGR